MMSFFLATLLGLSAVASTIDFIEPAVFRFQKPAVDAMEVVANGKRAKIHTVRQSAHPFNWWWMGVQRPLDQTEEATFASVTSAGPVSFQIALPTGVAAAKPTVRPLRQAIAVAQRDGVFHFTVPGPGQYVFEPEGNRHRALTLFVNPPKAWNEKWTLSFGPGEHEAGTIRLASGARVYIDAEAVVHGNFLAEDVSDVKICGYGVVDAGRFERAAKRDYHTHPFDVSNMALYRSRDIRVEGPIFVDAALWCVAAFDCEDVVFDRIKVIGQWRYNTDGIDLCNSRRVTVRNSFLHSFDDTLVVKGLTWVKGCPPVADIVATNCVLWCDWGRTCEVGIETWARSFKGVTFADCDLIHNSAVALDVQAGGDGKVEDVRFRNLRVECDADTEAEIVQEKLGDHYPSPAPAGLPYLLNIDNHKPFVWSCPERYSDVANVTVEDVTLYLAPGQKMPPTYVKSVDPAHPLGQLGHPFAWGEKGVQPGEKPRVFSGLRIDEPKIIRRTR